MTDNSENTGTDEEQTESDESATASDQEGAGGSYRDKLGVLLHGPAKAANVAVAGVVAAKDSLVDFLTANDKGAQRVADLAATAVAQVGEDLNRGDLTAEERMHRHEANERMVKEVSDNEKRVRKSNERAFAIAAFVVVTVVGGAAAAIAAKDTKA